LAKSLHRKIKPLTFLLLILTSVITTLSLLPGVKAETKIISIDPSSGIVGTTVQVRANISTVNGTYEIWFDNTFLISENASGNNVAMSFRVPHAPEGSHNIKIIDVQAGEPDTKTFSILTSYSFEPAKRTSPAQFQEGDKVPISVNMTGGKSNYTYPLIKVQTPSGNLTYEALRNITTTGVGDFDGNLSYPNDFSNGANTNFTGEYKILFNTTIASRFFIGVTNSSEYHRGDLLNIKAVDYPRNQNVTISIRYGNKTIDAIPLNVTEGIVDRNWPIPLNATVGNYKLSITPVPNSKLKANDTQIFSVPGFKTEILTRNLANETVPDIFVKVYDESAGVYFTNRTASGLAGFIFERGKYACEAFFQEVSVGKRNFTITNKEERVNLTCQLTNVNIKVIDAQNVSIPEVSINLSYNYTTNLSKKENRTETKFGETNITRILQFSSLLANITYIINASRYGKVFNQNNNTISNLPARAYVDVTIFCPAITLEVNVTDAQHQPIANVTVKTQELMGGLHYSKNTNLDGKAVLNCTFGKYFIKVYAGEIALNETALDLFQNQSISVQCRLYGLTVLVKVVDYFGQPISNANVKLQREGLAPRSNRTQPDGVTAFSSITGGSLQMTVYLFDQTQPCVARVFFADSSRTIEIRLEKYVILGGFLVETGNLATAIIIVATALLVLFVEVYRRKRSKPQKSPT